MSLFTVEKINKKLVIEDFSRAILYRADKSDALIVKFYPKIDDSLSDNNMTSYSLKEDGVEVNYDVEGRIITFFVKLEGDGISISTTLETNALGELEIAVKCQTVNYKKGKSEFSVEDDFEDKRSDGKGMTVYSRYFTRGKFENKIYVKIN